MLVTAAPRGATRELVVSFDRSGVRVDRDHLAGGMVAWLRAAINALTEGNDGTRVVLVMNGASAGSVGEPHENALPGRRRVAVRLLPCDGDRRVPGGGNSGPQRDVAGLVESADGDEDAGGILQPRLVEPAVVQARQSRGMERDTPARRRLSHR